MGVGVWKSEGQDLHTQVAALFQKVNKFATGVATKAPGDCKYGGERVCSGSIVKYFLNRRLVRQCIDGVFITKTAAAANATKNAVKRGGEDCVWYGRVYCDGDVMIDLYRWWFQMRCSGGKMKLQARQWRDVVNDSR